MFTKQDQLYVPKNDPKFLNENNLIYCPMCEEMHENNSMCQMNPLSWDQGESYV